MNCHYGIASSCSYFTFSYLNENDLLAAVCESNSMRGLAWVLNQTLFGGLRKIKRLLVLACL